MQMFSNLIFDTPIAVRHPTVARYQELSNYETALSTDYRVDRTKKAGGETIERMLTFCRATPNCAVQKLKLEDLRQCVKDWVTINFSNYESHQSITCVPVLDENTSHIILAPEILFRLDRHEDHYFLTERDSSGAAIHTNHQMALQRARDEIIERQSLCLFWYFGHYVRKFDSNATAFGSSLAKSSADSLASLGNISFIDVSIVEGWTSILAVLVNPLGRIKFAMGAAAAPSMGEAIDKASLELYQSTINMDQLICLSSHKHKISGLAANYLSHNSEATAKYFQKLPDVGKARGKEINLRALKCIRFEHSMRFSVRRPHLHFIMIKPLLGFYKMNYQNDSRGLAALSTIGKTFGYGQPTNVTPLPFA